MLTLSPGIRFAIGIFITLCIGISSGAVALTNAIPADAIKPVTAWATIFAFLGSAVQTGLQGLGLTNANKVLAAQSLPADQKIALAAHTNEVQQIVTTPAIAAAAGPTGDGAKVVSKAA
jgi:hypothetical protein